jgi:hypothetical protein
VFCTRNDGKEGDKEQIKAFFTASRNSIRMTDSGPLMCGDGQMGDDGCQTQDDRCCLAAIFIFR